jgi:tetratricopeptide (TPR) repeat protein
MQRRSLSRASYSNLFLYFCFILLTGCSLSFTNLEYSRGREAAEKQDYPEALKHFKRVLQRDPESEKAIEAARDAAKISYFETKNFDEAIYYYDHLVRYSKTETERRGAEEKIASVFFEKKNDYVGAIEEYNKLLLLRNSSEQNADFHYNLSRAHFYLSHFSDAQNEIEEALKLVQNQDKKFEMMMFQGNIYFNTKHADQAVKVYESIVEKFPEKAKADKVDMNIIVCYEEMEAFDAAIARLEKMRPTYTDVDFIDLKIKRLKERKANLPGSKGLRK